jgi:hypothetical protein
LWEAACAQQCCVVLQDRQVFEFGSDEGRNLMRRQPSKALGECVALVGFLLGASRFPARKKAIAYQLFTED